MRIITLLALSLPLFGQNFQADIDAHRQETAKAFVAEEIHHKLFWSSVATFGAASAFDYASSVRLNDAAKRGFVYERNAFLRNDYGGFDPARGAVFKLGSRAAIVATEVWMRLAFGKQPGESKVFDRTFAALNFGLSALYIRVGVSNERLHSKYAGR